MMIPHTSGIQVFIVLVWSNLSVCACALSGLSPSGSIVMKHYMA